MSAKVNKTTQYLECKLSEAELKEASKKLAEDARLAHAAAVEATQGREAATTLLEQPVTPVPIPKAPEPPKAAGASFTTRWKHEVTDSALVPRRHTPRRGRTRRWFPAFGFTPRSPWALDHNGETIPSSPGSGGSWRAWT
jgi:hypothetical protein